MLCHATSSSFCQRTCLFGSRTKPQSNECASLKPSFSGRANSSFRLRDSFLSSILEKRGHVSRDRRFCCDNAHDLTCNDEACEITGAAANEAVGLVSKELKHSQEADCCCDGQCGGGTGKSFSVASMPSASLTQTFTGGMGRMSSSVGTVGRFVPRMASLGIFAGPFGLLMAVAVAVAGFTSSFISHLEQTKEIWAEHNCGKCDGTGSVTCDLCNGTGEIQWEGKLYRRDPCPACLGKKFRTCPSCDSSFMPLIKMSKGKGTQPGSRKRFSNI